MYCSQVTNRRSHSFELCDCCIIIIFVMLVVLCGGQVLTPLPYFLKKLFQSNFNVSMAGVGQHAK